MPSQSSRNSWWKLALLLSPLGVTALFFGQHLFPTALSSPEIWNQPSTPQSIAEGNALFAQNCVSCHGPGGIGQNPRSPMGGMKEDGPGYWAPALNGTAHSWHHPNEVLFQTIRNGSVAADSPMRGFADRLTDQQIVSVMHYFQSLWPDHIRERHHQMMMN